MRLPGQTTDISPRLRDFLERVRIECKADVIFMTIAPNKGFDGRVTWDDARIHIEIGKDLDNALAEYIAAHELGHTLQLARGFPIAAARPDDPEAVAIATDIADLVLDSGADTRAVEAGFPMSKAFDSYVRSSKLPEVLARPANGRRFGSDWVRMWEKLRELRVCRGLGLKLPRLPR